MGAISACGKASQWQQAVGLFTSEGNAGIAWDLITYCSALEACQRSWKWRCALQLLAYSFDQTLDIGPIGYGAALSVCELSQEPCWVAFVLQLFAKNVSLRRSGPVLANCVELLALRGPQC